MTAPTDSEAQALLGAALLERYDREGDEACLAEAIGRFRDAIAAAPDDAVPADWLFWVGVAHVELADRRDSLPDYELGIAALTDVLDCLADGERDDHSSRDDAAAIRMEACWRRFQLLAYGDAPRDLAAAVEQLMVELDAFPLTGVDPEHADLERVLHGLAHLERHLAHGDRADLDRAIPALGAATALGLDDRLRAFGRAGLVDAYLGRAELDADAGSLDLAVAEAEAATGEAEPGTSGWRIVAPSFAFALQARWQHGRRPDDLDRAIQLWGELHADQPAAWSAAHRGELLVERAERRHDAADIAEAVRLLAIAVEEPDPDEPWAAWFELGRAHLARWTIARVPSSLDEADRCLDLALRHRDDRVDVHLLIQLQRGLVVLARFADDPRPSTSRMRRFLADCGDLVEAAETASPDARWWLALVLGYIELVVTGHDLGAFDRARVQCRLALARCSGDLPPDLSIAVDALIGLAGTLDDLTRPGGIAEDALTRLARAAAASELEAEARAVFQRILPELLPGRVHAPRPVRRRIP